MSSKQKEDLSTHEDDTLTVNPAYERARREGEGQEGGRGGGGGERNVVELSIHEDDMLTTNSAYENMKQREAYQ